MPPGEAHRFRQNGLFFLQACPPRLCRPPFHGFGGWGNRGVASFKYGSSTVLYKTTVAGATSATINGTNFPGLASRTISLEAVLNLGSKDAPDTVGDIVFSDGTVSAYTESLNAEQIAGAVAIIFDAGGKKGVSLNVGTNLQWAGGSWLSTDPNRGYNMMFSTNDDDGSGNWAVIQARDPAGAADAATWYPAFNWVNSYSAPGFTSGWYMPAKNELSTLYTNRTTVEAAFTALGMTSPFTGDVVSSSQSSSDVQFVACRTWGSAGSGARKTSNFCVCAVRVFN